jgi:hypothetical protein
VIDLVGTPYRLGADGSDGAIDCIHLVYTVLGRLGIATPSFRSEWYSASRITIARDLLRWGRRIPGPAYDGDVALLPQEAAAFAVTWQNGLLYINRELQRVAWCPIGAAPTCPCFRMRGN